MKRHKVGILGATGLVGQRLVERLAGHPWFDLAKVAASERSVGRAYAEAADWCLPGEVPEEVAAVEVVACDPSALDGCALVFSALDSGPARELEPAFARAGFAVVSNSSAFRQQADVPLIVPEINGSHLGLIDVQRKNTRGGFVVTNPNCSTTGLVVALAPLHHAFGVRRVVVTTLQAVSGAGVSGPGALAMTDNVLPYIAGEEDKLEIEMSKILGELHDGKIRFAEMDVSATCHRVGVIDGHLEAVSVELGREATQDEITEALRTFRGEPQELGLPSAPAAPVIVRDEPDRPQPRLDRDAGEGMAVVVGRVRPCPVLGWKMSVLSHNAVRGAAGGTLLNAELLAARGWLDARDVS